MRSLLWDRENLLAEVGDGGTMAAYTLAPAAYGHLVSQRRSGASSFHHYDALGSTAQLTGADGAGLAAYLYRAFGEQTLLSGSSSNLFTWIGRLGYYRQAAAGDYWVRARVVQARLGRWLSRDPIWSGRDSRLLNPYLYVDQNPVLLVDPNGMAAPLWLVAGMTACAAGAASGLFQTLIPGTGEADVDPYVYGLCNVLGRCLIDGLIAGGAMAIARVLLVKWPVLVPIAASCLSGPAFTLANAEVDTLCRRLAGCRSRPTDWCSEIVTCVIGAPFQCVIAYGFESNIPVDEIAEGLAIAKRALMYAAQMALVKLGVSVYRSQCGRYHMTDW